MPSNQTPNYALNQWEAADQVRMEDFNADNAKLDAAIKAVDQRVDGLTSSKANVSALTTLEQRVNTLTAGKADASALAQKVSVIAGAYTGDGAASRVISLGATPRALLLFSSSGKTADVNVSYGGLALPGHPIERLENKICEIVNNGFKVYYKADKVYSNSSGSACYYLALV